MNSEVKNEGLEVVAWLCSWIAGSYGGMHAGLSETSLDGLRKDRGDDIQIITDEPLCRHSEALAAIAVRDSRIAELELQIRLDLGDYTELEDTCHQLRAELAALREQVPVKSGVINPRLGKFKTSEGGRSYVADFFKGELQRYDFTTYINERLAADFACALADGLCQLSAAPVAEQVVIPDLIEKLRAIAIRERMFRIEDTYTAPEISDSISLLNNEMDSLNAADQEGGQDE